MSSDRHSEALHLSLSELVWTALMVLILVFAVCQNEARKTQKEMQATMGAQAARIATLEGETERFNKEKAEWERSKKEQRAKDDLAKDLDAEKKKNTELQTANETLQGEKRGLETRVKTLEGDKRDLLNKCGDLERRIAKIPQDINDAVTQAVATEKSQSDEAIKELEQKHAAIVKELEEKYDVLFEDLEKQYLIVSKDMIDIKGKLEQVVCIVDCSSSMVYEEKWDLTKKLIGTWMSHLPIQKLMLITYNKDVTLYKDGYINLAQGRKRGSDNPNLTGCVRYLEQVKPQGFSDTYNALKKAYEYDPDTIILFTDGSPNRTDTGSKKSEDEKEMKKIEELVGLEENRKIPINIIGFGDYFSPAVGNHIRRVTDLTEGTFLGR